MKKILVLHTGGTIAMSEDQTTGAVTITESNPLLDPQLKLDLEIDLTSEEIFNLPSPHITPQHMWQIKERILEAKKETYDGVVITHGTDTLEETAYFLDLTIGDQLPVVLTGAMRSSNEVGSDGLYNYQSALRVAASPAAENKGTLVVMNDEIHTARYVTKTHTTNVATFRTPTFGPIGLITKNSVNFYQSLLTTHTLNVPSVTGEIPIVTAYAGMGASILNLLAVGEIDGLVIEALGAGNLPPETLPAIEHLLRRQIPIVLVSRCFNGVAEEVYNYPGGGRTLAEHGVMFCDGLNGQKARLKLLIGLNAQLTPSELKAFITEKI